MALKGKIYSIAKQYDDLNTNNIFESMMKESADRNSIVLDGRNIAAGSIFAEQIHANAITAKHIESGAIKTDHMDAGTIDVSVLKGSQLILPGKNYGGVVINNNGLTMKSTGTAKLDIKLSSDSGFNITDRFNNQLIDINPSTGNVIMQVNKMVIGGYSAATAKDIDDIEVGGRNLLKNSKERTLTRRNSGTAGDNYNYEELVYPTVDGQTYTISADVEITDGVFSLISVLVNHGNTGPSIYSVPIENGKITRTYVAHNTTVNNRVLLYAGHAGETRGNGVIFRNIKIEKGNKATDWTSAPEDVQAEIDSRPTFGDFDKTDKVTINGGNIKAGTISSENNYSRINLDDGTFSFGNGRLVWNGSDMTVNGKISVSNITGDIPKSKLASTVQDELSSGVSADSVISKNKSKWDRVENKSEEYKINFDFTSSNDYIILLARSNLTGAQNYAIGTLTGRRVSGHYAAGKIDVVFNNNSSGSAPTGYFEYIDVHYTDSWSMVTCTYNGVSYVGLRHRPSSEFGLWNTDLRFTGQIGSSGEMLKPVQTSQVSSVSTFNSVGSVSSSTKIANDKATDAKNKTDAWSFNGTTMIDGTSIETGTLRANKITTGVMHGNRIEANTLSADRITGRIPGGKITLDGDVVVNGTFKVNNTNINSGIEANKITTGTMSGYRITANTLHGNRIVANTISADRINTDTLSAITANLGTVTAGVIKNTKNSMNIDLNNGIIETTDRATSPYLRTTIKSGVIEQSDVIAFDSEKYPSARTGVRMKSGSIIFSDTWWTPTEYPMDDWETHLQLVSYSGVLGVDGPIVAQYDIEIDGKKIVDSGSNSNGEWVKFYDGTMICRGYARKTLTLNLAWGGLYYRNFGRLPFPQQFSAVPYVSFVNSSVASVIIMSQANDVSTTQTGNIDIYRPVSTSSATYEIGYVAIGRWN